MERRKAAIYMRVEGAYYVDQDMEALTRIYQYVKSGGLYDAVAAVIDSQENTRVWEILQEEFRDGRFDIIVTTGEDGVIVVHETPELVEEVQPDWPTECSGVDFKDDRHPLHLLLGHDSLGHRTSNALRRDGVSTVEELREKDDAWFRDLRNLGEGGRMRIYKALGRIQDKGN